MNTFDISDEEWNDLVLKIFGPKSLGDKMLWLDIPAEVLKATETVSDFFKKMGATDWEFNGLADRNLVLRLRQELDALKFTTGLPSGLATELVHGPMPDETG